MTIEYCGRDKKRVEKVKALAALNPLSELILELSLDHYSPKHYELYERFEKSFNDSLSKKDLSSVLTPDLEKAIAVLTGKDFARLMMESYADMVGKRISKSYNRRSQRSLKPELYLKPIVDAIGYDIGLYLENNALIGIDNDDIDYWREQPRLLAAKINRHEAKIIATLNEMMDGENNVLMKRGAIEAIIMSDDKTLKDKLLQLLKSAGLQEGFRQAVLESADAGDYETFADICRFCREEDFFRFSSAVRAFFTWCGLDNEYIHYDKIKKETDTALNCLFDADYCDKCLCSSNPLEVYLGLWALGNREYCDSLDRAGQLIDSPDRVMRLTGWFYIAQCPDCEIINRLVFNHFNERDPEVLAYMMYCASGGTKLKNEGSWTPINYWNRMFPMPEDRNEQKQAFDHLMEIAIINCKKQSFNPSLFPFYSIIYEPASCNRYLLYYGDRLCDDETIMKRLADNIDKLDPSMRPQFYKYILQPDEREKDLNYLYDALNDKSIDNKIEVLEILGKYTNKTVDTQALLTLSASKSEKIRKALYRLLEKMPEDKKQFFVSKLSEGSEQQKQLAIELIGNDQSLKKNNDNFLAALNDTTLSEQSRIMSRQMLQKDEDFSKENGYGIYNPKIVEKTIEEFEKNPKYRFKDASEKTIVNESTDFRQLLTKKQLQQFLPNPTVLKKILDAMISVIEEHKDYQYLTKKRDNSFETVLFGNLKRYATDFEKEYTDETTPPNPSSIYGVPFAKDMIEKIRAIESRPSKLLLLKYMNEVLFLGYSNAETVTEKKHRKMINELFAFDGYFNYIIYWSKMDTLLSYMLEDMDYEIRYQTMMQLYFSLIALPEFDELKTSFGEKNMYSNQCVIDLRIYRTARYMIYPKDTDDEQFELFFVKMYELDRKLDVVRLNCGGYLEAIHLGLIEKDCFYERLCSCTKDSNDNLRWLTNYRSKNKYFVSAYPQLREEVANELSERMVRFESKRGQKDTPLSSAVNSIATLVGTKVFAILINALGNEKLSRDTAWMTSSRTRGEIMSSLLRCSYPAQTDTPETLKQVLDINTVSIKRLVEVAMFAPQWAKLIEQFIGWKGLNEAVWFFHAHMSEYSNDAMKETEVGTYSPISLQRFNDGAFDIEWYKRVVSNMDEKQMKILYDSAKFITDGSNAHRRVQLYVDAMSSKLSVEEMEKEIQDKRNQDKLRAYALIPLGKPEDEDLLRRYDTICAFDKGSKVFGAQRKASEKKAVLSALDNLAISCGLFDVNLMMWRLEKKKMEHLQPYFDGIDINGTTLTLRVDEDGDCQMDIVKNGKSLKNIPKEIAKDETVEAVKEAQKELKEAKTRNRQTLEEAMINQIVFRHEDIVNMFASAVLTSMIKKLVFINQDAQLGFVSMSTGEPMLIGLNGADKKIGEKDELRIAHPYDLSKSSQWSQWMHVLFEKQIVQPFKQVFREYYPLSPQEKEDRTKSTRYAGTQVRKSTMMGLLRSRGWIIDYEDGFEKVFYRQDVVAHIYAYADWFTAGDVEQPTMEEVQFSERYSEKMLVMEEMDPIVFSETMRDLDLVVSVAYVGDIDPQSSQSTIEMRISVARELCRLLKLDNVSFDGHFAKVEGKLSQYRIHMGSGTVNTFDKGVLPVFPVFSQQRGHIFLPFADEDPKTAQILSEIISFAQDDKLKDPSILQWLK